MPSLPPLRINYSMKILFNTFCEALSIVIKLKKIGFVSGAVEELIASFEDSNSV